MIIWKADVRKGVGGGAGNVSDEGGSGAYAQQTVARLMRFLRNRIECEVSK